MQIRYTFNFLKIVNSTVDKNITYITTKHRSMIVFISNMN